MEYMSTSDEKICGNEESVCPTWDGCQAAVAASNANLFSTPARRNERRHDGNICAPQNISCDVRPALRPKLAGRDPGAFDQACELRPDDLRARSPAAARETSVEAKPQSVPAMTRSRPTILASRTMRSATSSGCSTMTRGMRDAARHQHFAFRQPDVLPDPPFVLVARIGHLEGIAAGPDGHDDVGEVLHLHVVDARTHVDAVAGMVPHALRRECCAARD